MAEYMDKEAFKKSVEDRYCKQCKAEGKDCNGCRCRACWVDDMLDEVECFQPADVTPVVRCKDCKHYDQGECYHPRHEGHLQSICQQEDDFCSYGERKSNEYAEG